MPQPTNLPSDDLSLGEPDEITIPRSKTYLESANPTWLLTPFGKIIGANLLAQWLWEVRNVSDFFGYTAFDIFSKNRHRIPKEKNNEFFRKKIPVLKRLSRDNRRLYESFLNYIESDPDLRKIYNEARYLPDEEWESERVWEYPLIITPPEKTTSAEEFLKFQVMVYRLTPNNEFLGVYTPDPSSLITQRLVREKYEQAMTLADMIEYVQYEQGDDRGGEETITKEQSKQSPSSEPTQKVLASLENPAHYWRTLDEIVTETGLPPEEVKRAFGDLSDRLVQTHRRKEGTIFTTRTQYRKKEPFVNKMLSVLADRIK
jgi:hypothetical protein